MVDFIKILPKIKSFHKRLKKRSPKEQHNLLENLEIIEENLSLDQIPERWEYDEILLPYACLMDYLEGAKSQILSDFKSIPRSVKLI